MGQSKRREGLNFVSSFYVFYPLLEHALCKLGQPAWLFFSPEVLTLILRPSFVPLFVCFSLLSLLSTAIFDSFFPILTA